MRLHAFLSAGLGLAAMGSGGGYVPGGGLDPVTQPAATPASEVRCAVLVGNFVEVASAVDWGSYRHDRCGGPSERPYEETAEFEAYRLQESELLTCAESSAVSLAALRAHENRFVRFRAQRILDFWGPRAAAALPLLAKQLASASDSGERYALIQLLGSVGAGSGEIVAPLLEIVRSSRLSDRSWATEMLARTGPDGVAALGEALSDPEEEVRVAAARTLAHLGPAAADAVPELMQLLGNARGELYAVTRALLAIGEPAMAPLGRAVQSADNRLRGNAVSVLSQTGVRGVNALIDALSQDDPAIQETALRGLGGSGSAAAPAIPLIIEFLDSGEPDLRVWSIHALGAIRQSPSVVIPELIRMLDDPYPRVRRTAASTLGRWGPEAKAAVPALTRRLDDLRREVRFTAASALGGWGPEGRSAAVPGLIRMLDDVNRGVRGEAASTLGAWGPEAKAAVPALARRLEMEIGGNRHAIIEALGQMGPHAASALPELRALRASYRTDSDYHKRSRHLIDQAINLIEAP